MDFIDPKNIVYEGKRFRIVHCSKAEESLFNAMEGLIKSKRHKFERNLMQQMTRLADGEQPTKDSFPKEAELPDGKHFYAFKRIPVRAYCWRSKICPNTIFISHYVHKKKTDLDKRDKGLVIRNWRKKERRNES